MNDEGGWFVNQTGTVFLENGESQTLSFIVTIWGDPDPHNLDFSIITEIYPLEKEYIDWLNS